MCLQILGLWLICFVRTVRVEGDFLKALLQPSRHGSSPVLGLGDPEASETAQPSDGFPVEMVAGWLVTSSSSSSAVDKSSLIKVLPKIAP